MLKIGDGAVDDGYDTGLVYDEGSLREGFYYYE
jgi:hypothetical protein